MSDGMMEGKEWRIKNVLRGKRGEGLLEELRFHKKRLRDLVTILRTA